jgi:hypothetical protein
MAEILAQLLRLLRPKLKSEKEGSPSSPLGGWFQFSEVRHHIAKVPEGIHAGFAAYRRHPHYSRRKACEANAFRESDLLAA